MSVHVIEAKFLLLEVTTTTSSPRIWHMKSVHITEAKFLLRKVYYYIETQYLTHEVSTHHWGQVSTAKGLLLHWVPVSDTMMSVHMIEAKVLLLEVTTTTLSPSFWHQGVSKQGWGKVSTAGGMYYYIYSQYLTHEVSTHPWGQVSTARGQYYYIEF